MARHEVLLQDAIVAILIMDASRSDSLIIDFEGTLYSLFSKNPDVEYEQQKRNICMHLGMFHLCEK